MKQYKIRYQFYAIRAAHSEEAIRKAIEMIKRDVEAFVIDAEEPQPKSVGGLVKSVITGK